MRKIIYYAVICFLIVFIFSVSMSSCSKAEVIIVESEEIASLEEEIVLEEYVPIYTEYKSEASEDFLWNTLSKDSPSDYITAGVLGYFKRESELRSDCISNWHTSNAAAGGEDVSTLFTQEIDAGLRDGSTREQFIHDCKYRFGGYGLGQWSSTQYCEDLYDLAKKQGKSIGDAELQCEFVMMSMAKNDFLWKQLMEVKSATRAGELIALLYDGSQNAMGYSATMATYYYDKYVLQKF